MGRDDLHPISSYQTQILDNVVNRGFEFVYARPNVIYSLVPKAGESHFPAHIPGKYLSSVTYCLVPKVGDSHFPARLPG